MDKFGSMREELRRLDTCNLLRRLRCVTSAAGTTVTIDDGGRTLVNFCSNNYLNLAADPRVLEAACSAVRTWGFGAAASRLICGTMTPHSALEAAFAAFFKKQAGLLFSSGWAANEALLRTLPQKGDLILMDKADHASIIDAAAASEADYRTYRRGELGRLARLLRTHRQNRRFIVTESVFSMDGDCAELSSLVELKNEYDAILILDEAHSAGCMGPTGAGLAEDLGLLGDIDVLVAPLGKAFGAAGAVVAADRTVIDYLVNKARPFIYTTAPPAANCAAALAALQIVQEEPQRRLRLSSNAAYLRDRLRQRGLHIGNCSTWIIPVIVGDSRDAVGLSRRLLDKGFLSVAIRPPTVPRGTARLRISVQADHCQDQLDALAEALAEAVTG